MKHTLLLACISALALTLTLNQRLAAQSNPPSLAGAWQLTFSQTNPTPATTAPIEGLVTFTTDGSLVETDAAEVSLSPAAATERAHSSGTPGHGIWQAGPAFGNYYVQFVSLLITPLGHLQARRVVTITGGLDPTGNHFTGNYSAQIFDPAGQVTGTTSGNVTAAKMVHPALP